MSVKFYGDSQHTEPIIPVPMSDKNKPTAMAAGYVGLLKYMVERAREQGYALGLHGSMNRDLDLIAVPWVADAKPAQDLVDALAKLLGIMYKHRVRGPYLEKPHRRLVWNIHLDHGAYIDLSVILREQDEFPKPRELPEVLNSRQRHSVAWRFRDFKKSYLLDDAPAAEEMDRLLDAAGIPHLSAELTEPEKAFLQHPDQLCLEE